MPSRDAIATPVGAQTGSFTFRKSSSPKAVSSYSSPLAEGAEEAGTSKQTQFQGPERHSYSPPQSRHTPLQYPPRWKSADAQIVPIDPSLLDSPIEQALETARPANHTNPSQDIYNFKSSDLSNSSNLYDQTPPGLSDPFHQTQGLPPWPLQTSNLLSDSQAPTSISSSPATPGLGLDGLYNGDSFDLSRQSSMSDLDSYVGATKGHNTAASSENGFDPKDPDADGGIPPPRTRKSHARKQPEGHIKRARNAFILFRKHVTDSNLIPPSVEVKHQNISVVMWREAPQEVRQKFQEQARIEKEEHAKKYPGYRYQPVFRRTDIIRRRVRKDPAEDEKVDAVAEALIKGKTGEKLEEEIKEQLISRSEASESEADSTRTPNGTRRRRREVGQLSKGAIRAQRAQARAKQMRQNLLGSNLLNMSLYNAANQNRMLTHPGAQHYGQYAMQEQYLHPVQGYDIDGNPLGYSDTMGVYGGGPGGMDAGDMYRLPPIDGMGMVYDDHHAHQHHAQVQAHQANVGHAHAGWGDPNALGAGGEFASSDYWSGAGPSDYHQHAHLDPSTEYYTGMIGAEYDQMHPSQYQLAPMMDLQADTSQEHQQQQTGGMSEMIHEREPDPRMNDWARDGQQTPSGHVLFNERLFDGALGSASLPALLGEKDDLAGFDEAMAQASEVPQW